MTINDIPVKENKTTVTDTIHLLSAEEFNAVVDQIKSNTTICNNIKEAPSDGKCYVKKDGEWVELTIDDSFCWDD